MDTSNIHKGSQETYEYIADFIDPHFFFSKKDQWHRMGILGVWADYVLHAVKGHVAEVGVGESSIYLGHAASKYDRNIFHCDIAPDKIVNPLTVDNYLVPGHVDIPVPWPKSFHFGPHKFFMGPSDEFFIELHAQEVPLALAFIDGDHHYEQARKDFFNAVDLVVDNGYIILHDTYPPSEDYLCPDSACGDVYRLRQEIEQDSRFDTLTLTHGAMGVGLTLCRKKPQQRPFYNG